MEIEGNFHNFLTCIQFLIRYFLLGVSLDNTVEINYSL